MKTILHATDYSENAISALKYAYELSVKTSSKLYVIHVFDNATLSAYVNESYIIPFKEDIAQKNLVLTDFCKVHLGDNFNSDKIKVEAINNNSVVNAIIEKSIEIGALLVVVGVKGESFIKELLIGSTTKKLIKKSNCPVLAIPINSVFTNIKQIAYATDYEEEDINAVYKLSNFFKKFKVTIKIIHVSLEHNLESEQEMEWFKELLKQKVTYSKLEFVILNSKDIYTAIKSYINKENIDLIAMLQRKDKGFMNSIFNRELIKKVETTIKIPLICYNEKP